MAHGVSTAAVVVDNHGSRLRAPLRFRRLSLSPFPLSLTDPRHPFHLEHMALALNEAAIAFDEDEVPIGAVIVSLEGGVIASAHNQREQLLDPTAHAEMIAITQAAQTVQSW